MVSNSNQYNKKNKLLNYKEYYNLIFNNHYQFVLKI